MSRIVVLALCLTGCLSSTDVVCDGFVCPGENQCDNENHRCIDPEQLVACSHLGDGAACRVNDADGACRGQVCELFRCGDGLANGGEECDGVDLGGLDCTSFSFTKADGLRCLPNCRADVSQCLGFCGDGVRDANELCDGTDVGTATCLDAGFYGPAGLTCDQTCHFATAACVGRCGDGIVNGPELCDGPFIEQCLDLFFDVGTARCGSGCTPSTQTCGRIDWRAVTNPVGAGAPIGVASHTFIAPAGSGLARFQGGQWEVIPGAPGGTILDARSLDDITVLGASTSGGTALLHFDGTSVTELAKLDSLTFATTGRAFALDDIWLGTDDGLMIHWDGAFLAATQLPQGPHMTAMFGAGPDDIWAVGFSQAATLVFHYNGTTWAPFTIPVLPPSFFVFVGFGAHDIWLSGPGVTLHFDGTSWTTIPLPADIPNVQSSVFHLAGNPRDLLGLADAGPLQPSKAIHWDGERWQTSGDRPFRVSEIAAFAGEAIATATDGNSVMGFEARGVAEWSTVGSPPDPRALFVASQSAAWVISNGSTLPPQLFRWNGVTWQLENPAPPFVPSTIAGVSPTDVWAGNAQGAIHFDGVAWTERSATSIPPATLQNVQSIWGSITDAWAIDNNGDFWRWDGTVWSPTARPPGAGIYTRVTGSASNDVWAVGLSAVGGTSEVAHFDGTTWTFTPVPAVDTVGVVRSISPVRSDEAWIAADKAILVWNGVEWALAPGGPFAAESFHDICALGLDDVYAVSGQGLSHFDGTAWGRIRLAAGLVTDTDHLGCASHIVGLSAVGLNGNNGTVGVLEVHGRWACRAHETACDDDIDDDCDGLIDHNDSDCP